MRRTDCTHQPEGYIANEYIGNEPIRAMDTRKIEQTPPQVPSESNGISHCGEEVRQIHPHPSFPPESGKPGAFIRLVQSEARGYKEDRHPNASKGSQQPSSRPMPRAMACHDRDDGNSLGYSGISLVEELAILPPHSWLATNAVPTIKITKITIFIAFHDLSQDIIYLLFII